MSLNAPAWILSNSFTKKAIEGSGAIKGSPATVKSSRIDENNDTIVTFAWEEKDETESTMEVLVKKGYSVASARINDDQKLVLTLDNGTDLPAIELPFVETTISKDEGNAIEERTDGLYVATPDLENKVDTFNANNETFESVVENAKEGDFIVNEDESGEGGGGGGDVKKEDLLINVRNVKRYANKFTERLEFVISAGDTEYPKWQDVTDPEDLDPVGDPDDPNMIIAKELYEGPGETIELNFLFDTDCKQPIYFGGYQYIPNIGDNVHGAIAIKLGNIPDNDVTMYIDISHMREVIDNG